ncbi:uncharacterized protein FOMMEDRAFT_153594 [Fomitiporia mediterranea MF3/22]|uniref:uncharacterized protein n=1 Tax=Fomitiporia mediterranea (strain MF3/22) TaxID=694068 RepID=UPI0004407A5A|nr:uncharacterized protein FOMMEDRAFT_153594 [Fomitiporia mediterranea MF3/22]EJD06195.1 hypothetical protein FOMMEDRAFT_153594 [Fomitiporia mediterranea MF3/22]
MPREGSPFAGIRTLVRQQYPTDAPTTCHSFPRVTSKEEEGDKRYEERTELCLPAELIGLIFEHTLPDKPSLSSSKPPLSLTQVCRSWRAIAFDTPRIWATILIPDWQELPKNAWELVKLWVEKSGEAPLDIDISLFNEDVMVFPDPDTLNELHEFLKKVLEFLKPHRARMLRFRGVFPEFLMEEVGVSEMVNAEHVYYCGMLGDKIATEGMEDSEIDMLTNKLDVGPQRDALRSLAICGCAANISSVQLQNQLTHIELLDLHRGGEICQETAFQLMQNMPKLKNCILDLTRFERQDWTPPERCIVLENLELLFLSWVFPADIDNLLRCISAPKLTKLGLRGTPMVPQRPWTGLHDFLEASKAPIERVSLGDFSSVDVQYLRCFAHLPNLVHLTLNHCEIHDSIFHALTCTDPEWNSSLLPNLQIFNMGVCEGFEVDSLVNFLKSRAKDTPEGVLQMTEVAIMYCMKVTESVAPRLHECGIENLILEAAEDDSVYPYARVVETHRELLAVLYQAGEDELPPFPELEEMEGGEDGGDPENSMHVDENEGQPGNEDRHERGAERPADAA